jgi:long-chain acyl-CoA synthetase
MNLVSLLADSAAEHPARVAIRQGTATTSYAELDAASARVAGLLTARGVGPGTPVGLMLPNVPEFAVVYYGVLRAGGIVVPMNPLLKAREVAYYLSDSGAPLIFAWHSTADEAGTGAAEAGAHVISVDPTSFGALLDAATPAPALIQRDPSDTAVLLYTSGTTGRPKGAELTHDNLLRNVEVSNDELLHLDAGDVVFGGLPLFHAFGQTVTLNTTMTAGATLLLLPRFTASAALDLIAEHGVTVFVGVPTMYSALLASVDAAGYDATSLRVCVSGGAAMPVEVLRQFEQTFGATVLEGYGLSETSPVASFNLPGRERKPGSIGTPVRGVQMRIVDTVGNELPLGEVGEIAIRGHNVMKGYWNNPDATAQAIDGDGWFKTGDLGRVDEDGYFFVVDRKKDLIIRGGYNVYPREIEEVLYEHPDVREAAVIGVPHPELGEEVAAVVTVQPGAEVTPDQLRDFVKAQVAAYKYPRRVWFTDELPKGPTGKILKREIAIPDLETTK